MRRVQAILVIVALLVAPLSLLAHSTSADPAACGGMCCLPHHGHQQPASHQPPRQNHQHRGGESCDHGATGQLPNCAFDCSHPRQDYSFISPLAPTKPSNLASIARFNSPKAAKLQPAAQNVATGFLVTPFQPPRA